MFAPTAPRAGHLPAGDRRRDEPTRPPSGFAAAASAFDEAARRFDVDTVSVADAEELVPVIAAMGRQIDAVLALLGARVAEAAVSDRAATRWWSQTTGESGREAHRRIITGQITRRANGVRSAALAGALTTETARAIAAATQVDPGAEARLLALAADGSAEDVRREARRVLSRARDESEEERQARLHAGRRLHYGEDDEGATSGRFKTTNAQWAPVRARLEVYTGAAFTRARRLGERAPRSAYAMDALALMAHVAAGGHPSTLGYERDDLPAALARLVDHIHGTTCESGEQHSSGAATHGSGEHDPPDQGPTGPHEPAPADASETRSGVADDDPEPCDRSRGAAEGEPSPAAGPHRGPIGQPAPSGIDGASTTHADTPSPRRRESTTDRPGEVSDAPVGSAPRRRVPARRAQGPPQVVADKVIVRVDLTALRRGDAVDGETCDIAGVGAVPVATARAALGDTLLALIVTDGHDVATVAHAGRRANAWQRTALEWRFDECATQGCHNAGYREVDHSHEWADTHYTFLPTLRSPCSHCHGLRTKKGWAYVGRPDAFGKYRLVPPTHADHPDRTESRAPTPSSVTPTRRRARRADPDATDTVPPRGVGRAPSVPALEADRPGDARQKHAPRPASGAQLLLDERTECWRRAS